MNLSQFSMLNKQISLVQMQQHKLTATSLLLQQIQMNQLLLNEEAEMGVSANSEDQGTWQLLA